MIHTCHAHGCTLPVPPRMFMCRGHWRALRKPLQDAIWREYRPGQEVDKRPSARYMAVQQLAIAEVAFRPLDGRAARISAAYLHRASAWRWRALRTGRGDPFEGLVPDAILKKRWRETPMAKKSKKAAAKVKSASKPSKKAVTLVGKRQTVCGLCQKPGHNMRTCKKNR